VAGTALSPFVARLRITASLLPAFTASTSLRSPLRPFAHSHLPPPG